MRALRLALSLGLGLTVLAACGGSQPPIGAPGVMPQSRAIAQHAAHGKSLMLPEAQSGDLLYVSETTGSQLLVFSFPSLALVGTVSLQGRPLGLCSDSAGDIYVTTTGASYSTIYEYAHAGTQPIKTLTDPGEANSCSIDPLSGDLAVTNRGSSRGPYDYGDVAIFPNAQGSPLTYYDPNVLQYYFCAYDENGNLYADGDISTSVIDELPKGGSAFSEITLNKAVEELLSIQWYNGKLTMATDSRNVRGKLSVYKVEIADAEGTIVGKTSLWSPRNRNRPGVQLALASGFIAGPGPARGGAGLVEIWKFAKGGKPIAVFKYNGPPDLYGSTVSITPHRYH